MPTKQPLVMYSRINTLCRRTVFSLILHEVHHLKRLIALLSRTFSCFVPKEL